MDQGIALIAVIVAAITAGVIVWLGLRRNLPPEAVAFIAEAAAQVRALLGAVVTEAQVRDLAGWMYDRWGAGSRYVTRDEFIELVVRAVMQAAQTTPATYTAARADGVITGS